MRFNRANVLYPILDAGFLASAEDRAGFLRRIVQGLAGAGVGILQYRNKTGDEAEILADARVMREAFLPMSQNRDMGHPHLLLILNDFPELVVEAGFDG